MEKVCCEFRLGEDLEMKCVETDDGFRIELKGDKEKLRNHIPGLHCVPFVGVRHAHGSCCCC